MGRRDVNYQRILCRAPCIAQAIHTKGDRLYRAILPIVYYSFQHIRTFLSCATSNSCSVAEQEGCVDMSTGKPAPPQYAPIPAPTPTPTPAPTNALAGVNAFLPMG